MSVNSDILAYSLHKTTAREIMLNLTNCINFTKYKTQKHIVKEQQLTIICTKNLSRRNLSWAPFALITNHRPNRSFWQH